MPETTFEKERSLLRNGLFIIGVDEVGRGPLAGPVVAGAACFQGETFEIPDDLLKDFALIRDSKTLSPKQREKMDGFVREHFWVGLGQATVEEIDRVNILQASFLAMYRALEAVKKFLPNGAACFVLVDGSHAVPGCVDEQEAVVGGDGRVKSIAAASIVAKVARDRLISKYDQKYPDYGFARHKGYGTREHMEALRKYGPTPIHRLSFTPVKLAIPENVNRKFAGVLRRKK